MISAGRQEDLLNLGVPDRRLAVLPEQFRALLADEEMVGLGQSYGLDAQEQGRLLASQPLSLRLCQRLATYNIPESLDHGDFHDGNVFVSNNGTLTLFDWGDSSVTHPFFSLRTTFVSLENTLGLPQDSPWHARLRDAYLEAWVGVETPERLLEAFILSQRLAPITAALRWAPAIASLDVAERAEAKLPSEYAHAIPSLLREFLDLNSDGLEGEKE